MVSSQMQMLVLRVCSTQAVDFHNTAMRQALYLPSSSTWTNCRTTARESGVNNEFHQHNKDMEHHLKTSLFASA